MKKILIVGGDSFSDKDFRTFIHPELDTSWPKWPELLAKKLDMECINLAKSGAGNDYIYESLLETIQDTDKNRIGLVIAGWSQCQRRSWQESKDLISSLFGREYETSAAMTRLVFGGVLEKYPELKIITHHFGGMVSYLDKRIDGLYDFHETLLGKRFSENLTKRPIDYYRMFYCDTAYGNTPGLICAYSFFGADHVLFATDMPYDSELGSRKIRTTINSIDQMDIPEADKNKIFEENTRRILPAKKKMGKQRIIL